MEIDDGNGNGNGSGNGNGDGVDDDAVGYGRPPKHTRWKKGQSGNPAGRPKGARGLKTDLRAELISRMEISMNGKRVSGTKQQLMLRTLTARAASGDVRATRILIDLVLQVFGPEDQGSGPKALSRTDQQILDELLGRRGGQPVADNTSQRETPIDASEELRVGDSARPALHPAPGASGSPGNNPASFAQEAD